MGGIAGDEGLRAACAAVWGAQAAAQALDCWGERKAEDGTPMRVRGLLAAPAAAKRRRGGVQLFVNGRPVQSRRLSYAVEGAYAELLPGGRYPLAAIFLELPPQAVDVNVHPTKAQVKLHDEGAAFGLIQTTARRALLQGLTPAGVAAAVAMAAAFAIPWEAGSLDADPTDPGRPRPAWDAQAAAGTALREPSVYAAAATPHVPGLSPLRLVGPGAGLFPGDGGAAGHGVDRSARGARAGLVRAATDTRPGRDRAAGAAGTGPGGVDAGTGGGLDGERDDAGGAWAGGGAVRRTSLAAAGASGLSRPGGIRIPARRW